jgi:guanylate kinase
MNHSSGTLYIVSAPSGAGKTSLVNALIKDDKRVSVSVSHTTRGKRPGEEHGVNYHFVSHDEFKALIDKNDFLEHAEVFGNFYGTSRSTLQQVLDRGDDLILEIDWQGARQVRQARPDTRSIFILPPSLATLRQRLEGRATDSPQVIARRLADAQGDMSHCLEFDYAVINEDFGRALADLQRIIAGQGPSLRADRPELAPLLANLLA